MKQDLCNESCVIYIRANEQMISSDGFITLSWCSYSSAVRNPWSTIYGSVGLRSPHKPSMRFRRLSTCILCSAVLCVASLENEIKRNKLKKGRKPHNKKINNSNRQLHVTVLSLALSLHLKALFIALSILCPPIFLSRFSPGLCTFYSACVCATTHTHICTT